MKNLKLIIGSLFLVVMTLGCKKMIAVDSPKNQLTTEKVFVDSASATAVLLNVYASFERDFDPNYNVYIGLYTDELKNIDSDMEVNEFFDSRITSTNGINQNAWSHLYKIIYQCNDIELQLKNNTSLSRSINKQLTSEAKFLRSLAYFYLVNTYGDVPLLLQTDVEITAKAFRDDQNIVNNQIINDLIDAKAGLSVNYVSSGKVRANKWAASALLSRAYLYQKKWALAEKEAGEIIESGLYTPLLSVKDVFKANSKESILQFWNQNGFITSSSDYLPYSAESLPQYIISSSLYESFEAGDLRKDYWVGTVVDADNNNEKYYFSNKYKNRVSNTSSPEYLIVLRIAEQFLIRAESRVMLGNINGAIEDINVVRKRSGLMILPDLLNTQQCLDAIIKERRLEFFTENGHRFFDLKRSGRLNEVMSNYKNTWRKDISKLWPIPQSEITYNHNLIQNTGY